MIVDRERVADALPVSDPLLARTALADEWRQTNPASPSEIADFYRRSTRLRDDLEAWHQTPERQSWTAMLVHVAKESGAKIIVDIGAGAGHDLAALRTALGDVRLIAIEPNEPLYDYCEALGIDEQYLLAIDAPVEDADLLICIDVLEHVVDPETFLGGIAQRAKEGCVLVEATATFDAGTPLHLKENSGWHPGRVLERHGWELVDYSGRLRVWRRTALEGRERASLLLCAYRSVNAETMTAVFAVCAGNEVGYRLRVKTGDALISRSRSIIVTAWYRETNDTVCLIIDDDITFTAQDVDHIVELCSNGHDIIVGAYPVRNGGHMACRFTPEVRELHVGPEQPPLEIVYGGTGFMAIHRRVIDALVADMPLCHANQQWSFFNLFPTMVVENPDAGGHELLSEDWSLCALARQKGFKIWLDATVKLKHASVIPISAANMADVYQAVQKA